jgi:hypothetical protein
LENKNYVNKTIKQLELENGEVVTSTENIIDEQKSFYEKLYKSKDDQINEILSDKLHGMSYNVLHVSDIERESLEGPITHTELLAALARSKYNKSPWLDGYTAELFVFFWKDLGNFLLRSINWAYKQGERSITHNMSTKAWKSL